MTGFWVGQELKPQDYFNDMLSTTNLHVGQHDSSMHDGNWKQWGCWMDEKIVNDRVLSKGGIEGQDLTVQLYCYIFILNIQKGNLQ